MKRNYLFLADGFEELEAIAVIDLLRRAGMDVCVISAVEGRLEVKGAHDIVVTADASIEAVNLEEAEWLILPGGYGGTTNLASTAAVNNLLLAQSERGGRIAAICAAPTIVLAPLGLLKGRKATCYPGMEAPCIEGGAEMVNSRAVVDGNLITGNGPASAIEFAAAIIENTVGAEIARQVTEGLLY